MVSKNATKIFNPLFFFFGILSTVLIILFLKFADCNKSFSNKIYPNVFIDKIDFSGKTKTDILKYFKDKSQSLEKISITIIAEKEIVATFSGQQLDLKYDGQTAAERAFYVGRSPFFLSAVYQKMITLLQLSRFDFISSIDYDKNKIREKLEVFKEKFDKPAKNALFKFENGKVVNFRKEENGREIIIDSIIADIDNSIFSLKNKLENKIVKINPVIIKPEITLSSINDYGIEELIAEGKSDYTHSIPGRIHNIILAASKFNGVLIPPGKIFSFNEAVGDISSLTGYQPAYIIKDGKTVLGDGGGVCQVSTTLFRAAINAGLPIIERTAHAYRVGYYENDMKPGFDATVFSPTVDLKIKNDTPSYILIQTEVDEKNNLLYFRFFGKKDDRKVEVSDSTVWDIAPPPEPKYQEEPTLKKGVVKQVDFPSWGAKALFNYKVYKKNKLVIDQKFFSSYRPWQAVYLVGTAN